jgi:hypothetical protein
MRARRLKKHPVEERETRVLRELKKQKVVGVLEDKIKPIIIQAPRVIPKKVSRTEFRKLEQEILKKTEKMADIEYPFFRLNVEKNVVYTRGKDGRLQSHPVKEETMKKFRKLMGETKRNIGKDEREELR